MSIDICTSCQRYVDTDFDVEAIENGDCLCFYCREDVLDPMRAPQAMIDRQGWMAS
jgi:hypothetical protein